MASEGRVASDSGGGAGGRWRRDPALPLPRTEVTRFPHAVLEVKLSLPIGEEAPDWIKVRPCLPFLSSESWQF